MKLRIIKENNKIYIEHKFLGWRKLTETTYEGHEGTPTSKPIEFDTPEEAKDYMFENYVKENKKNKKVIREYQI